ncbi:MAG TPA: protein arginine kinase [Candidatus Sumerlaeota bacterium]|nr:MAG: putative ATP:guanido phosphotransferase [candidate division BRC1 bacterium ADurb.Bin183]HOE64794.1 protein arginine kinase [Candidatus Sumerlaeota bacterium]HRR31999.1 protein arginine kinase [Candidatus Sumerlaeia bacterium]HON51560.1 protein arginine kinase [Candidatus Sumerlaeota bacterium]HOR65919.1 protein arginine kinase [Candidatus Sumerlaeota bacterium]
MKRNLYSESDIWLKDEGDCENVVISSRIRLARNLSKIPFSTHAKPEELANVERLVDERIQSIPAFNDYESISLHDVSQFTRRYLKESHIISPEMEKGGEHRKVYLSPGGRISIMVNEEDHLRFQILAAGYNLREILDDLIKLDTKLVELLPIAFSEQLGFLTACPTNLGTGLRVSVMLHLPGLVFNRQIEDTIKMLQPLGVTIRGFYGEDSEFTGDVFQISNEASLGKNEEAIVDSIGSIANKVIEQEEEARMELFDKRPLIVEDTVWRSFGILSQARLMDTQETMKLLSRIRLGIERKYFSKMNHYILNRLFFSIQPAHVEYKRQTGPNNQKRDAARAELLRCLFTQSGSDN